MNLIAGMVRGMKVSKAMQMLKFTNKKAADILYKLIASAKANAEHNFKQDPDRLIIEEIVVNEGTTYKRRQPISRGRAHPILKRTSHVTVKVGVDEKIPAATQSAKLALRNKKAKQPKKVSK